MKRIGFAALLVGLLINPSALAGDSGPDSEKRKVSYSLGYQIGTNLKRQSVDVDLDMFRQGVKDALTGDDMLMTVEEQRQVMTAYSKKHMGEREAKQKETAKKNKEIGRGFLGANKGNPGVVVLRSGLQYKVIREGKGPKPLSTDTVKTHYKGTLIDGTVFDSSYARGEPASFPVNGVIRGWTEALQLMNVGSKWLLFIPSDLAYGDKGAGDKIEPGATLLFDVELLEIVKK